jgi:hypothetical protein
MNASAGHEVLSETDQVEGHRGNPSVDTVPQELRSNEQTSPWNPGGPDGPDEGAFTTFVGGAGI